jgi:hypothetical protein
MSQTRYIISDVVVNERFKKGLVFSLTTIPAAKPYIKEKGHTFSNF